MRNGEAEASPIYAFAQGGCEDAQDGGKSRICAGIAPAILKASRPTSFENRGRGEGVRRK